MTTDHNEAMRLADALLMGAAMIPEIDLPEAAALLRKQAERIAELELQPAFAQLASDLAAKLADTEAERDTLRAEVERLRVYAAELRAALWHVKHIAKDIDAAKTIAGDAIDTARKATP